MTTAEKKLLTCPDAIPRAVARQVDASLAEWFSRAGRSLKFRDTTDPYAIMVSEFMLQQTTVVVVEPYYERFIEQFPTVKHLAEAAEEEVLAAWAGLGYYRRARQLHLAAKALAARPDKSFPAEAAELIKLPGFGRYTAGAVSSQAYDLPAPILEANTIRVFARLAGINGTAGETGFMKALWKVSESLVAHARSPRLFNRAAMELGALVCRPDPQCDRCPVQSLCLGFKAGSPEAIPQKAPRRESIAVSKICLVIEDKSGRFAVTQIPAGEWHAGMWQFPTQRTSHPAIDETHAVAFAANALGVSVAGVRPLKIMKYQVTHHKISCHVFHCHCETTGAKKSLTNGAPDFLTIEKLSQLPMGSAQNKLRQEIIHMTTMAQQS